jgi:molecular chaperone GrpE
MKQKKTERIENIDKEKQELQEEVNEDSTVETVTEEDKEGKKKGPSHDKQAKKLNELEGRFNELSDRHLRLQAEFDNFRKRTVREKAELIRTGGESVLTGILPVIDDFERAIDSLKEVPEEDPAKQGTLLIYSKFREFLKQNHVNEIDALNKDFDVDHHEALTKIPAPEEKFKGKVVDVIQKGYTLHDKVIRYAKVVVGE